MAETKHTDGAVRAAEVKYQANFLWGFEDGSLESIGYEFCNAKTEEYCRMQWRFLKEKIAKPANAVQEITAERDRLKAEKAELVEACKLSEAVLAEHEQYDDDDEVPSRESEAAEACRTALANAKPK